MIKTTKTIAYDDVLLVPQYSDIESRKEINIEANMGNNLSLRLPVISSPMDTISELDMSLAMDYAGGCAVVHRYNTIQEQMEIVRQFKERSGPHGIIGAAVGVSDDYMNRAAVLRAMGIDFLCVDVAHGHHVLMERALKSLRDGFGEDLHLMAGNVATLEGVNALSDWRCNIGGGSICSTRIQTGHGLPGLQTIIECAKTDRDVAIIADGGIKNSGDIVKALAAGADAVMVGSLLSGTTETPGKVIEDKDGLRWKFYRGMASKKAQIGWRGKYSSHEGISTTVPFRGPVSNVLDDIERGVRSGLSYSGARTIKELQSKAEFVVQTSSGLSESRTHITARKW